MILEAEKSKNMVLISTKGFCAQSFHCRKWVVGGEQERDTVVWTSVPQQHDPVESQPCKRNLAHLMHTLKGTLRPKSLPLGTLPVLPCSFTMVYPSPKAQRQRSKLSMDRKFQKCEQKEIFHTLNTWSSTGGAVWEGMELFWTWVQADKLM